MKPYLEAPNELTIYLPGLCNIPSFSNYGFVEVEFIGTLEEIFYGDQHELGRLKLIKRVMARR